MIKRTLLLAAVGVTLGSCGVSGAKGNDTGGIIPWSPEAERTALAFADHQCYASSWGRKSARITSVRRVYGDYIVYQCVFDGPWRRSGRD
ncbi:MAG: hypothetical protein ABWY66_14160 [Xanthobacteraceae bacterium]